MHTAATTRPYLSRRQKRATGTTTSRINRKTRAGRAEQCCAPVFNYGRTLGQPSRPAEVTEKPGRSGRAVRCLQRRTSARTAPSVGRTRRKIRSTRVNSTGKQLTGEAVLCTALYTSKLLDQSLTDLFTIKCVVPNSGIIVPLPRRE